MDFDKALSNVGPVGRCHLFYLTILGIQNIFSAPLITSLAFVGKEPDFSCKGRILLERQQVCDLQPPCEKYEYSKEFTSIVSEWDLVCGLSYKTGLAQSIVMLGFLIGNVLLGEVSDRIGRLKTLTGCSVVVVITQFSMLFCPNYVSFVISRLIVGICVGGIALANYCILVENVMPGHRAIVGCVLALMFAFGCMLFAVAAYFIRDWRMLSFAIGAGSVPYMFLPWMVPESPRWLANKGRLEEAEDVLFNIARKNGSSISRAMISIRGNISSEKGEKKSTLDSFRTPVLRRRMLILMFCWFTVSFVYYGLTMNSSSIGSNMYTSFALSGLAEFPAHILCLFVLDRCGRRRTLIFAFLLGGVSCMLVDLLPENGGIPLFTPLSLSLLGKMGISMAFNGIYLFSLELVPTSIRNGSMGVCSMAARLGGIVAPAIANLGEAISFMSFSATAVFSGLFLFSMPETFNKPLPETIDDVEKAGDILKITEDLMLSTFSEGNHKS